MNTCSVEGCGQPHDSRGLCKSHYDRAFRPKRMRVENPLRWFRNEPMPCSLNGDAAAVMRNLPIATADSARERDYASHDWPMSDWEPDAEYQAAMTWDDPEMVTDAERRLADWWERDRRIQNAHRVSLMSAPMETAAD